MVNQVYWQDFNCAHCHCYFTYEKKTLKLIKYVLYVDKYRLACNLFHNTFDLGVFEPETLAKYKDVYQANFIPNLTPENALEKVKTILVFL